MKYDLEDKLFIGGILILAALIVFALADGIFAKLSEPIAAIVVDRAYTPSSVSTGVGTAIGADGKSAIVVTTSSMEEQWIVIVNVDGKNFSVKANSDTWSKAVSGNKASIAYLRGWITGSNWGWVFLG